MFTIKHLGIVLVGVTLLLVALDSAAGAKNKVIQFTNAVTQMDAIIEENKSDPTDTDARRLCLESRRAFFILAIAFTQNYRDAEEMSNQLLNRYERAKPLLNQCGCKLCLRMANSVRRRRKYVAAIVRYGSTYVTATHLRALAAEP